MEAVWLTSFNYIRAGRVGVRYLPLGCRVRYYVGAVPPALVSWSGQKGQVELPRFVDGLMVPRFRGVSSLGSAVRRSVCCGSGFSRIRSG